MPDSNDLKAQFEAFSKSAVLDVILPRITSEEVHAVLKDGSPEDLKQAPSRRNLFFDEKARITLVLKTGIDQEDVRKLLPSVEVVLAAHATDAVPQGTGNAASASGKHDITSRTIPAANFVEMVAHENHSYIVWSSTLHLTRPRARLQRPAVYFTANLTISAQALTASRKPEKDYLTPFEPLPGNVLASLNRAPEFRGKNIFLSEDRITKVAPKPGRKDDAVKPIRGASKRAFPALPALFSRIKYSHVPNAVIASLHIETSSLIAGTFNVEQLEVSLPDPGANLDEVAAEDNKMRGIETLPNPSSKGIELLTEIPLPLKMQAGDETVVLYRLKQKDQPLTLSVHLSATASLDQGSQIELDMNGQSQVEQSRATSETTYHWSQQHDSVQPTRSSTQSVPRPASSSGSKTSAASDIGVTFFFTGPPDTRQNADFAIKVMCVNKSGRTRRFELIPSKPVKPPATSQPITSTENADRVAEIFNAPLLARHKIPDVLCDTPIVKVGPLHSGACFETQIDFRALAKGVLDLGTVRIVDADTRQTVDVKDLPDIIALEPLEGSSAFVRRRLSSRNDEVQKQWRAASEKWHDQMMREAAEKERQSAQEETVS